MIRKYASCWLSVPIVLFFGITGVQGQSLSSFDFLRLEPSAQATALGGTLLTSASAQGGAIFYNPALLGKDSGGSLSVSWLNHLSDLQSGTVTYAHNLGSLGTGVAGVRFFHWGRMTRANMYGEKNGTFSSSNIALSAGLSRAWIPRLRYGANLHVAYTSIAEFNAIAIAMDAGIVYHVADQGFTASVGATNVGHALSSLGQVRDKLPADLRMSVSKRLKYIPVLVGLTVHHLQYLPKITSVDEGFRHAIFSLEFQAISAFHIRMGYNHRRRNLKSDRRLDLAGTTVGFGLRIRRFHLDYSFNSWSFAGLHQFTISTRFRKKDQ